jgi:hypothetical protein
MKKKNDGLVYNLYIYKKGIIYIKKIHVELK